MASRSNALSEIARFWLQARHGCLLDESVPVPVKYGLSDIDFVALRPDLKPITLPNGEVAGPRMIVEAKDEHDWEPVGIEFGNCLRKDLQQMGTERFVPRGTSAIKFTMLKQEHFDIAASLFATEDFDRLMILHALSPPILDELTPALSQRRIHVFTVHDVVRDLKAWYASHQRKSGLRNTLAGDMWHLLVGYCDLS